MLTGGMDVESDEVDGERTRLLSGQEQISPQLNSLSEAKKIITESGLIFASYMPTVGQYIAFGYILSLLGPKAIEATQATSVTSIAAITLLQGPVTYSLNMMSDLYGEISKIKEQLLTSNPDVNALTTELNAKIHQFRKIFWTTNIYSVASNLLITIPSYLAARLYMPLFVDPSITEKAYEFLLTGSLFILPWALSNVTTNLLIVLKKSNILLISNIFAAITSYGIGAVLALGLFDTPRLGIKGIALGQTIGSSVTILAIYAYCYFKCNEQDIFHRKFLQYFDKKILKKLLSKGVFISLLDTADRFNLFFLTYLYASLGTMVAISSNSSLQVLNIFFPLFAGVTMAANHLISFYNGKLNTIDKTKYLNFLSLGKIFTGAIVSTMMASICFIFPYQLISFFGSDAAFDPNIITISKTETAIVATSTTNAAIISHNQSAQIELAKLMLTLTAVGMIFDAIAKVCLSVSRARDNNVVIPSLVSCIILNVLPLTFFAFDKIINPEWSHDEATKSLFYMQLRTYGLVVLAALLFVYQFTSVQSKVSEAGNSIKSNVSAGFKKLYTCLGSRPTTPVIVNDVENDSRNEPSF